MSSNQQIIVSQKISAGASNGLLTNLVSYYSLEANGNDSHGSNNCSETNTTYVTGKVANACSFNGSTSTMRTGNITLSAGNSPYTINFWVKLNAEISSGTRGFVMLGPDATLQDTIYTIEYQYNAGTRRLNYQHYYNGPETYYTLTRNGALGTANWNMITLVYSGSGMNMYVNGSSVVSGGGTGTYGNNGPATYQKGFTIGSEYVSSAYSNRSNAIIDEVGFRNTNIDSTKITALYNSGSGLAYSSFTS